MTETIKEEIRKNIILITILLIAIIIFLTQTIFSLINIEKTNQAIPPEIKLIEECNKICQTKGLVFSVIDIAGIGYTEHKTEGRCICFNTTTINNS